MKQTKKTTAKIKNQKAVKESSAHLSIILFGDENIVNEYAILFSESGIETLNEKSLSANSKKIAFAFELTISDIETKKKNLQLLDKSLPPQIPIISSSICVPITEQAQWINNTMRLLGIAAFPTLLSNSLLELTPSIYTSKQIADSVQSLFANAKKETVLVQDSVGMVMPRILCQVVNEAFFAMQEDIAQPNDIDEGMKLAISFPHGPIEWAEKIGFKNIVAVLDALYSNTKEERYRIAPLLRQMAIAGKFWKEQ